MFKSIVESYWPRLHKFAQIYVLDREVAKEIVQDTFLVLWKQREKLDKETCLITYLMVICRNKCFNYLKGLQLEQVEINDLNEFAIYQRSNDDKRVGIGYRSFIIEIICTYKRYFYDEPLWRFQKQRDSRKSVYNG